MLITVVESHAHVESITKPNGTEKKNVQVTLKSQAEFCMRAPMVREIYSRNIKVVLTPFFSVRVKRKSF